MEQRVIHHLPAHTGYILHERAEQFYAEGTGFLSIKTFFEGDAEYRVGRGRYSVGDNSYFVLNHGQPYTIIIDSLRQVESFCLFFAPGFAESVYHDLRLSADHKVCIPNEQSRTPLHFFERTYAHDDVVSPILFQLRCACLQHEVEQSWLIEQFHAVMQRLLYVHTDISKEVSTLPAIRASTREELYRRLYLAKDYADALFATQITVNDMAMVAGLSTNHLLRVFKHIFHQSPYQYITARRLEHAQHLLRHSEQSVTEICFAVGFQSLGAFSWRFRQRVGVSPQMYRQQSR